MHSKMSRTKFLYDINKFSTKLAYMKLQEIDRKSLVGMSIDSHIVNFHIPDGYMYSFTIV